MLLVLTRSPILALLWTEGGNSLAYFSSFTLVKQFRQGQLQIISSPYFYTIWKVHNAQFKVYEFICSKQRISLSGITHLLQQQFYQTQLMSWLPCYQLLQQHVKCNQGDFTKLQSTGKQDFQSKKFIIIYLVFIYRS